MLAAFSVAGSFLLAVDQICVRNTVGPSVLSVVRPVDKNPLIFCGFLISLSTTLKSHLFAMHNLEVIKCFILVRYNNKLNLTNLDFTKFSNSQQRKRLE